MDKGPFTLQRGVSFFSSAVGPGGVKRWGFAVLTPLQRRYSAVTAPAQRQKCQKGNFFAFFDPGQAFWRCSGASTLYKCKKRHVLHWP